MTVQDYETFLRNRITELRLKKDVSEHRMGLDLGKSGSYIHKISSGAALPSVHELFNIIEYFELSPAAFFAPCEESATHHTRLCERLRTADEETLTRVETLLGWMDTPGR